MNKLSLIIAVFLAIATSAVAQSTEQPASDQVQQVTLTPAPEEGKIVLKDTEEAQPAPALTATPVKAPAKSCCAADKAKCGTMTKAECAKKCEGHKKEEKAKPETADLP